MTLDRAQVATRRRELFPDAPADGPVELVAPKDLAWSPRRWVGILACMYLPGFLLLVDLLFQGLGMRILWAFTSGAVLWWLVVVAAGLAAAATATWFMLVAAHRWGVQDGPREAWDTWASDRGLVRVPAKVLMQFDVPMLDHTELGAQSGVVGWLARSPLPPLLPRVGARHLFAGTLGAEGELVVTGAARWYRRVPVLDEHETRKVRACFAAVQLPEHVAEVFPASRLARILTSIRATPARELTGYTIAPGGRELTFESIDLHETASIEVAGGDDLAWRRLFDPTVLAALAHDLDVEFQQRGRWLVVAMPAKDWWRRRARSARMDTLCAAARLLEVRFTREAATMLSASRAAARSEVAEARRELHSAKVAEYLGRERARDLQLLDPEELFGELAKFVSADELALIRTKVDAGTFPLHMLDDLVHHRRSSWWGATRHRAA